jgi:hypothetical protein
MFSQLFEEILVDKKIIIGYHRTDADLVSVLENHKFK